MDSTNGVIISKIDSEKQNNGQGKSGNSDKLNDSRSRGNSDQIGSKGRGRGTYEKYGNRGNYNNYGNRGRGSRGHSNSMYDNKNEYNNSYRSRGRGNYNNYGNRDRGSNSYNSNYNRSSNDYKNYGNKKNGECYECGKFGHYAVKCPSKNSAKSMEMEVEKEEILSFQSVQLKATQVAAFYPTIPKMLTQINVGEAGKEIFECDTATSHNILKRVVYDKLRNKHPEGIPELVQEKQQIQLADGTISKKMVGSVSIKVQASNSMVTRLDFFVMNSPNNLLGRLALEKLWPQQYNALKQIAEVPFPMNNVKKVPVKKNSEVSALVSRTEVTDGSSSGGS